MAFDKKKALNEIRIFALMILIVSSLRSALADWNDVPTGSMKPTIQEGDRVVVNKLAYDLKVPFTTIQITKWGDPRRGDIVVLSLPSTEHAWSSASSPSRATGWRCATTSCS